MIKHLVAPLASLTLTAAPALAQPQFQPTPLPSEAGQAWQPVGTAARPESEDCGPACSPGLHALSAVRYPSISDALSNLSRRGGGTIDFDGLQGRTIAPFTIPGVPVQLRFGIGVYNLAGPIVDDGNRNLSILGSGLGTELVAGFPGDLLGWRGAQPGLAGARLTEISRVWLEGRNVGRVGASFPDTQFYDGHTVVDRTLIHGFRTAGLYAGISNYFTNAIFDVFKDNGVGLWAARDADTNVEFSVFTFPRDKAMLELDSIQDRVVGNAFYRGDAGAGSAGLGPDILLSDGGRGNIGAAWIVGNKHGPEGEAPGRDKVLVQGTSPTARQDSSRFVDNWYEGLAGSNQVALDFQAPPIDVLVDGNHFQDIGLIVNDVPRATGTEIGGSIFTATNTVENADLASPQPTRLFAHGGFGFYQVTAPPNLAHINLPDDDAGYVQNRAPHPVDIAAWGANNVTITERQPDPFGGTDGYLISKSAARSANASTGFSTAKLLDDTGQISSGRNGRVCVALWMKAGSLSTAMLRGGDASFGTFFLKQFSLSNAWKLYRFELTGIDGARAPTFSIYPGGVSSPVPGTIYVAHVSISDFCSEFVPYPVARQRAALPRQLILSGWVVPRPVAAQSASVQRFRFDGARVGDIVTANSPVAGQTAGIALGQALVAVNDNIDVSFMNPTAASLRPAAGMYQFALTRAAQ